jgi:hypothetical protein
VHRNRELQVLISVAGWRPSGTIDYPDQATSGILITTITYTEPTLHFESIPIQSFNDGTMTKANSEITGNWIRGGASLNLILKRTP